MFGVFDITSVENDFMDVFGIWKTCFKSELVVIIIAKIHLLRPNIVNLLSKKKKNIVNPLRFTLSACL